MFRFSAGVATVVVLATLNGPAYAFGNISGLTNLQGPSTVHAIKLSRDEKCVLANRELAKHRSKMTDEDWRKYGKMHKQNCFRKVERKSNKRACREYAREKGYKYNQKTNMLYDEKSGWRNNCLPDFYGG